MNARWKFRAVDHRFQRRRLRLEGLPIEIRGSAEEALHVARRIAQSDLDANHIKRVEVEAVKPGPVEPSDRLVCMIRQRSDGRGWMTERNELLHPAWHLTILDALDYAAFRTRGRVAEFHVLSAHGALIQLILMDQRHWKDGLAFPKC